MKQDYMKIDLHIHTSTGSDGALTVEEVFQEAQKREIDVLSITDHDAIHHQGQAIQLARKYGIIYITGMELNVTFEYRHKSVSLDFLVFIVISVTQEICLPRFPGLRI